MPKILIRRFVPEHATDELKALLNQLRSMTLKQPGYVSGETLKRIDSRGETLVISTWQSVKDWDEWMDNEERIKIQTKIDFLLGIETEYAVYDYL